MQKITNILKQKFTHSVEMVPPRNGASFQESIDKLEILKKINIDFMSVTRGAGGSLRSGTLPLAYYANEKLQIPTVAHLTCRESDEYEIENELIDHHYFGLRNILALRGDPPDNADKDTWGGVYKYAYQLVQQIKNMNEGKYLLRRGFDKSEESYSKGYPTEFCIGVAAHPEDPFPQRIDYLKKKVTEGAEYAITQMIFDINLYKLYLKEVKEAGITIPILPGIWPMDAKWKLEQAESKFHSPIPKEIKERLQHIEDNKEFQKEGIKATIELCKQLKNAGAPGVHLFIFQDVDVAEKILTNL